MGTPNGAAMNRTPEIPEFRGVFSPSRAGALSGVSGNRIGQWARRDLIRPSVYEGRPANLYSFFDVAHAIVVHWLRDKGFTYSDIHDAIEEAGKTKPDWPLMSREWGVAEAVPGERGVIARQVGRGYMSPWGQSLLEPEAFVRAGDVLRKGGWIAEQLGLQRIEVNPAKLGGAPTLRGRRWPIERVARIAEDLQGRELLLEEYGLQKREVDEAIRWAEAAAAL